MIDEQSDVPGSKPTGGAPIDFVCVRACGARANANYVLHVFCVSGVITRSWVGKILIVVNNKDFH
jgi:hypothetical protein